MKYQILLVLGILAVLAVSGCSSSGNVITKQEDIANTSINGNTASFTTGEPENGSGFSSITYDNAFVLRKSTFKEKYSVPGGRIDIPISFDSWTTEMSAKMICYNENRDIIFDYPVIEQMNFPYLDKDSNKNVDCLYTYDVYKNVESGIKASLFFMCYGNSERTGRCKINPNCTGSPYNEIAWGKNGGTARLFIYFNFLKSQTRSIECIVNIQNKDDIYTGNITRVTKSFKIMYDAETEQVSDKQVINNPLGCNPDYIFASIDSDFLLSSNYTEYCKALCYKQFQTTSFKLTDQDNPNLVNQYSILSIPFKCYCDINKCGQVIDERTQKPKEEIQAPKDVQTASLSCSQAGGYIQGSLYDSGSLSLLISNNGKMDLTFIGVLVYQSGDVLRYPDTIVIPAGSVKTLTMTGVTNDLEQVSIQSEECPGVQDLLYHYNIVGMG